MAFINAPLYAIGHFHPLAWVKSTFAHWSEVRRRHNVYVKTLQELQCLTDYELADINLSRIQIRDIAYEIVYGKSV